ncbi:uracil-DNA glycosylase [Pyronema omphalodes]|nr:uracil-DNA glycosylase [Pyronema omphalodes]
MAPAIKRKAVDSQDSAAKKSRAITSFFAPAPASSSPSAPATTTSNGLPVSATTQKFNKEKWVASLTPEKRELLALEIETMHESWLAVLKDDLVSDWFAKVKEYLKKESGVVYPPSKDIYSWSRYCPLDNVKVVILGQDPYHGPKQAHGLSFSVIPPTPAPPSLKNIYKCLKIDFPDFVPPPDNGGCLIPWAERGVLMLNASLTVRAHQAGSHAEIGWHKLTSRVLNLVAEKRKGGVVFMAWGAHAEKRVAGIDKERHHILKSVHPSPLSARRGFFECAHFKKANEWLFSRYGERGPIDWSLHGNKPVGLLGKKENGKVVEKEKAQSEPKEEDFGLDDDEEAFLEAAMEAEKSLSQIPKEEPSNEALEVPKELEADMKDADGVGKEVSQEAKVEAGEADAQESKSAIATAKTED